MLRQSVLKPVPDFTHIPRDPARLLGRWSDLIDADLVHTAPLETACITRPLRDAANRDVPLTSNARACSLNVLMSPPATSRPRAITITSRSCPAQRCRQCDRRRTGSRSTVNGASSFYLLQRRLSRIGKEVDPASRGGQLVFQQRADRFCCGALPVRQARLECAPHGMPQMPSQTAAFLCRAP